MNDSLIDINIITNKKKNDKSGYNNTRNSRK